MKYFHRLVLVLFFTLTFSEDVTSYSKLPKIGNNELKMYWDGEKLLKSQLPIEFSDLYKDGPLLLSFWFLGCGPCVSEMKHLSKFNEKYKDTGFKVVSINTDKQSKGRIKSFIKKKKYSFEMLFDQQGKDGVIKKLGGVSCPYTVLINTDGTIYSKHIGYERGEEIALEKEINELIKFNKSLAIDSSSDLKNNKEEEKVEKKNSSNLEIVKKQPKLAEPISSDSKTK
jgi:peroxiredoxin